MCCRKAACDLSKPQALNYQLIQTPKLYCTAILKHLWSRYFSLSQQWCLDPLQTAFGDCFRNEAADLGLCRFAHLPGDCYFLNLNREDL